MTKDIVKKAKNGTYYFRANLGYHPITGKQIQKYRNGFKTKKEVREEIPDYYSQNRRTQKIVQGNFPSSSLLKIFSYRGTKLR